MGAMVEEAPPAPAASAANGGGLAEHWRRAGHAVLQGVVDPDVCDRLREHIHATAAEAAKLDRSDLFGYIQEQDKRYDVKLDLCAPVLDALNQFVEHCGPALSEMLGDEAYITDLSAITSYPGAQAQTVHMDTVHGAASCVEADLDYTEDEAELEEAEADISEINDIMETDTATIWTALIALQDVDASMGPTHVWPGTNTFACHAQLLQWLQASEDRGFISVPEADQILGIAHKKMTLAKGSLVVYDSRTVHCGGANCADRSRTVLGISVMGPGLKPDGTTWSMLPTLRHKFHLGSFPLPAEAVRAPTSRLGSDMIVLPPRPSLANEGDAEEVPLLPELMDPSEVAFRKCRVGTPNVRDRVLREMEEWYFAASHHKEPLWLPVDPVEALIRLDLGLHDARMLEVSLGGPVTDLLRDLKHIEVSEEKGKCLYRVEAAAAREPETSTLTITSSKELRETVLKKAADATLEIPSLEFEIGPSQEQCVDTLYNHIAKAQQHLDAVGGAGAACLVEQLQQVLDCASGQVALTVRDPSALSDVRPPACA